MRTLRTPAFTLEPQTAAHAAEMFVVLGDPAIYEFEGQPPPSESWLVERYRRLESRRSADGTQHWLNWVIRLNDGVLAGYVQATVLPDATSLVAYELGSRHWRRGIGRAAVAAMLGELEDGYAVRLHAAALKSANFRSRGLLERLEFRPGGAELRARLSVPADETLMVKPRRSDQNAR